MTLGRPARIVSAIALLGAFSWTAAFLWNYVQSRTCGQRGCPPSPDEPPIRLPSGAVLSVITVSTADDGHVLFDYLTPRGSHDYLDLCGEARQVWTAIRDREWARQASVVHLGPTSSEAEYLGLGAYLMPVYRCCGTTYFTVTKDDTGEWRFRQGCARE
jgi:hypothetical protein